MTASDYRKAFDEIREENIFPMLNEVHYTITDASCLYRRQEGLDKYSCWPLHVLDVVFEEMDMSEILLD